MSQLSSKQVLLSNVLFMTDYVMRPLIRPTTLKNFAATGVLRSCIDTFVSTHIHESPYR
jgi:hypothetical protein